MPLLNLISVIKVINRSFSKNLSKISGSKMKYLSQQEAISIDEELFNECLFSVDQLMELAGLSCSSAISHCYAPQKLSDKRVLVCCGPGNNGGDGLVIARHLAITGYHPYLYYPKKTPSKLYNNLLHQCTKSGVTELSDCPKLDDIKEWGLIIDALFGFSFKPPVRENFFEVMDLLRNTNVPIVSVDIPSGWDVEFGPNQNEGIQPDMLISLTAPKKCAMMFVGSHHCLGGLFIPQYMQKKYELNLPSYPGTSNFIYL